MYHYMYKHMGSWYNHITENTSDYTPWFVAVSMSGIFRLNIKHLVSVVPLAN